MDRACGGACDGTRVLRGRNDRGRYRGTGRQRHRAGLRGDRSRGPDGSQDAAAKCSCDRDRQAACRGPREADRVALDLTLEEYHDEIKTGIEHQKVIRGVVAAKISVEDFEVRALYSERYSDQPQGGEIVHLRQILVTYGTVAPENKAAVCKSVHKAKKRIETGEAFEKVASEISEVAAAAGGDIGWLHSDSVASWMSSVVDPLGDGQMTDVIELPFGCSLLKLVERREYETVGYEDVKEELSLEIYQTRLEEEFREWMEQLRARTYIERKGHFADAAMLGSRSGYSSRPEEEDSRF